VKRIYAFLERPSRLSDVDLAARDEKKRAAKKRKAERTAKKKGSEGSKKKKAAAAGDKKKKAEDEDEDEEEEGSDEEEEGGSESGSDGVPSDDVDDQFDDEDVAPRAKKAKKEDKEEGGEGEGEEREGVERALWEPVVRGIVTGADAATLSTKDIMAQLVEKFGEGVMENKAVSFIDPLVTIAKFMGVCDALYDPAFPLPHHRTSRASRCS
jgi:hypothetical protein